MWRRMLGARPLVTLDIPPPRPSGRPPFSCACPLCRSLSLWLAGSLCLTHSDPCPFFFLCSFHSELVWRLLCALRVESAVEARKDVRVGAGKAESVCSRAGPAVTPVPCAVEPTPARPVWGRDRVACSTPALTFRHWAASWLLDTATVTEPTSAGPNTRPVGSPTCCPPSRAAGAQWASEN